MKKIVISISILLTFGVLFSAASCAPSEAPKSAATNDSAIPTDVAATASDGDFRYTILDDGTAEITLYQEHTGSDSVVSVPASIDGHTVTRIGKGAFSSTEINTVVIPDSVTSIGEEAFWGCSWLETVILGKSVAEIDDSAFINPHYESLNGGTLARFVVDDENTAFRTIDGNLYNRDATKLIRYANANGNSGFIIPDSVTDIAPYALFSSGNLTSVTIPDSVKTIGREAFYGCVSLRSVTIPASVVSIGEGAIGHYYDCINEGVHTTVIGEKGSAAEAYAANDGMCDFVEKKD